MNKQSNNKITSDSSKGSAENKIMYHVAESDGCCGRPISQRGQGEALRGVDIFAETRSVRSTATGGSSKRDSQCKGLKWGRMRRCT